MENNPQIPSQKTEPPSRKLLGLISPVASQGAKLQAFLFMYAIITQYARKSFLQPESCKAILIDKSRKLLGQETFFCKILLDLTASWMCLACKLHMPRMSAFQIPWKIKSLGLWDLISMRELTCPAQTE